MAAEGLLRMKLKSPTCYECAVQKGYVPVTECHTVYLDKCSNCEEMKPVSTSWDYRLPNEKRFDWD